MSISHTGRLEYSSSEEDTEDLFASPSKVPSKPRQQTIPTKTSEPQPQRKEESQYDAEAAKEAGLRRELESVKSVNAIIEGVVSSLESASGNMNVRLLHTDSVVHLTACILTLYTIDRLNNSNFSIYVT